MVMVCRTKSESVILGGFISTHIFYNLQEVVQLVKKFLAFDAAQRSV
jgi:hypothetical protein